MSHILPVFPLIGHFTQGKHISCRDHHWAQKYLRTAQSTCVLGADRNLGGTEGLRGWLGSTQSCSFMRRPTLHWAPHQTQGAPYGKHSGREAQWARQSLHLSWEKIQSFEGGYTQTNHLPLYVTGKGVCHPERLLMKVTEDETSTWDLWKIVCYATCLLVLCLESE